MDNEFDQFIATTPEDWARYWHENEYARERVEDMLRTMAAASPEQVRALGLATSRLDPAAVAESRRTAYDTFFELRTCPIIGEELASCELDEYVSRAASSVGEPREHQHGASAPGDTSVWASALRGARDAMIVTICADELGPYDKEFLSGPWKFVFARPAR